MRRLRFRKYITITYLAPMFSNNIFWSFMKKNHLFEAKYISSTNQMKIKNILALPFLFLFSINYAQIPQGYYDDAESLTGESLKTVLHQIIKDHVKFPYSSSNTDTWDILKEADKDTANPDHVILFYSGWSVNASQEYNNGMGWNREHVWAKSHGDFDTNPGAGTDAHHLRPSDISINNARSNKDFDNGGVIYVDADGTTECKYDIDSWEPRDAVKGDVARMLLYMSVRYEGENGEVDLELIDDVNTASLNTIGKGFHGKLSTLLEWHYSDPVDSFEINRNNVIYSYQKNRNPFIDHPEFAEKIWSVTEVTLTEKEEIKMYPSPIKDFVIIELPMNEVVEGTIYSISGENLLNFEGSGRITLCTSHLKKGNYIISLKTKNKTLKSRLIVKR